MEKVQRITLRVPDALYLRLQRVASVNRRSMNTESVLGLEAHVAEEEKSIEARAAGKRLVGWTLCKTYADFSTYGLYDTYEQAAAAHRMRAQGVTESIFAVGEDGYLYHDAACLHPLWLFDSPTNGATKYDGELPR